MGKFYSALGLMSGTSLDGVDEFATHSPLLSSKVVSVPQQLSE